jgi:hypothetical protein
MTPSEESALRELPGLLPHKLGQSVKWPEAFGRRFMITVDTEEEFDWEAPFERSGHTTVTVPKLERFQQFAEKFGIKPVYFIDYSIIESDEAVAFLKRAVSAGIATVGAHLHPWVTPPFEEQVNNYNSFAGNLPVELEERKLVALRDAIAEKIGVLPTAYRAGRYGIGPQTVEILQRLGFEIDSSIRSRFDYSSASGPDFTKIGSEPFWWHGENQLLEVPLTTVYSGMFRKQPNFLAKIMNRYPVANAVFARSKILDRIPLTPEGVSARETKEAIDVALDDDVRLLVFSFHSPSLSAGHTPYVRTSEDLNQFYDWWRDIINHLTQIGVMPVDMEDLLLSAKQAIA